MSDPAEMRFFDLGFSKGVEVEQERIIKLLEDNAQYFTTIDGGELIDFAQEAIALIKGGQKLELNL